MIPFGERLKQARKEAGFRSQEALAEALDCAKMTVHRWEKGETEPSFGDIEKISQVLGKPVYWFFMPLSAPEPQPLDSHREILSRLQAIEQVLAGEKPSRPGRLGFS